MTTKTTKTKAEAVRILKEWGLVDGSTVYAKVNKVSASGMSRNIELYLIDTKDGRILNISYHASRALGWSFKDGYDGGVRVTGCGMDMMFHTVDSLSYAMGYGTLNQDRHDMHIKYNEKREDCKECTGAPIIGLKYKQL